MGTLTALAKPAVEKLLKYNEDELYEQLGMTARAMAADPTVAGTFDPVISYNDPEIAYSENAREFGRRLFRRWNVETYKLICGDDIDDMIDREELTAAFSINDTAVASALSSLLVTHIGLAPPLSAVIASLVIKRFSSPGHEEFCKVWKRKLRKYE
jgi:hypothetical protein